MEPGRGRDMKWCASRRRRRRKKIGNAGEERFEGEGLRRKQEKVTVNEEGVGGGGSRG